MQAPCVLMSFEAKPHFTIERNPFCYVLTLSSKQVPCTSLLQALETAYKSESGNVEETVVCRKAE